MNFKDGRIIALNHLNQVLRIESEIMWQLKKTSPKTNPINQNDWIGCRKKLELRIRDPFVRALTFRLVTNATRLKVTSSKVEDKCRFK